MKTLDELTPDVARRLEGLFFDLDDTVLTHGLLVRAAFDAIWNLHEAGLKLVAVTGRPSGWAEVLVRQWPIDGAVTENGSVFVVRSVDGKGIDLGFDGEPVDVRARRARLDALVDTVHQRMPHVRLSDDTHARRSDVAWDIGERVVLPSNDVEELAAIVIESGARTTRSTVHLHATFERDDKASGAVRFAHDRFGADPAVVTGGRWAFAGDSPNDAACFAAFQTTFGVANVARFISKMSVPPRYVASKERGEGFAEIAARIISAAGGRLYAADARTTGPSPGSGRS